MRDLMENIIRAVGGPVKAGAIAILTLLVAGLFIAVLIYPTEGIAIIVLCVIVFEAVKRAVNPPEPLALWQIEEAAGYCLEDACNTLKGSLSVFADVKTDTVPLADGSGVREFPRWRCTWLMMSRARVVRLGLLKLSKTAIPEEVLQQECRVIQTLVEDNINRGLVPYMPDICYKDGTPILNLVKVFEDRAYVCFDFVCVQDDEAANFVERFGCPPNPGDAADQDF